MKSPAPRDCPAENTVEDAARPWIARRFTRAAVVDRTATFGRWRDLLVAGGVALAIPYGASIVIPLGIPLKERLDPAGYWLLPTLHQVAAALLTVVVIRLISTKPLSEWGFNLRHWGKSLARVGAFAALTIGPLFLLAQQAPAANGTITMSAIVAVLSTHLLVIGTTQEILYRGLVMGFLDRHWGERWLLGVTSSGWWAALIFVVSHIKPYPPFVWPAQLILSLVFGLLYARIYDSTRSLLGPSLAHGFSNTAYVASLMLLNA